jgi:hypothetical protein
MSGSGPPRAIVSGVLVLASSGPIIIGVAVVAALVLVAILLRLEE